MSVDALWGHVAARLPSLAVGREGERVLAVGSSRVHLKLVAAATPRAIAVGGDRALVYRVEPAVDASSLASVRDAVLAVVDALRAAHQHERDRANERAIAVPAACTSIEQVDAALAADTFTPLRLGRALAAAPSRLIEPAARWRRALVERGVYVVDAPAMPPCLDLSMRPVLRQGPVLRTSALAQSPCARCAAAPVCAVDEGDPPDVQPLVHRAHRDAALAALRALARAVRLDPTPMIELLERLCAETAVDAEALPIEFSLKRGAGALVPSLRAVSYAPQPHRGADRRRGEAARRSFVAALTRQIDPAAAEMRAQLLEALDGHAGFRELSLGVALDSGPSREARIGTQLYVHVEPGVADIAVALDAARRFVGAPHSLVSALEGLGLLVLVDHAPSADDPRRVKLYFARPCQGDEALGLPAPSFGPMAHAAAARGLAVFVLTREGLRFEKWDSPCALHPQRCASLYGAFVEGLEGDERERAEAVFDGASFLAWPTWISSRGVTKTLYFVAR